MQVGFDELSLGVEIEFSGISRFEAAQVLVDYFGTTFVKFGGWNNEEYHIPCQKGHIWQLVNDGSVDAQKKVGNTVVPATEDYKCELITPVMSYHDISTLLGAVAALKAAGGITGANCGIHVHIGAEKFDPKSLRVLCNLVYSKQYLLANALTVKEVRKGQYCSYLTDEFIRQLNSEKPTTWEHFKEIWYTGTVDAVRTIRRNESRYRIINLHNLLSGRQPTIEYRLYNSVLDTYYVKAYIQFSLLLTCQALRQKKALTRMMMSENSKFTFRVFLLKINAIGSDFRGMRLMFLRYLEGDSGRRHPKVEKEPVPSKNR
jgi:hypothetical protein